jgi:predicted DNA-binding antitoxin AbrB/MazE fold protein
VRTLLGGENSPAAFFGFSFYPARRPLDDRLGEVFNLCYSCLHGSLRLLAEGTVMTLTIEAIYENGVLKPVQPLPLQEHERVRVTVESAQVSASTTADEAEQIVRRSYGLLGWTGDVETLRRVAEDPEFSILESP